MTENFSLGYWIKRQRRAHDMTQEQLARLAGVATVTLRKIEADDRRPSLQLVQRLADIFRLDEDERERLLHVARADLAPDHLAVATQPIDTSSDASPLHTPPLPTGTVTFLFTDIEGSTRLWERHPHAMPATLKRHDAILQEAIGGHGGAIFSTGGDGFCAAFARATDALSAALMAQQALHSATWGETGPLQVRMALHTGVVVLGGDDYQGLALSRVARLLAAGHGGQILLSRATEQLVREHLPPDVTLRALGEHRLKDLTYPEHIVQLITPDLPADFPPLKTLTVQRTNLPIQPTPLIGRTQDVAAVLNRLQRTDVRLMTLTGPGGVGKTRLALQTTAELLDAFADGCWFVNLASTNDPVQVVSAIAQTLGVPETADTPPLDSLKAYLRDKQQLLLLDNFEQVADAAPLVAELLTSAPCLKVLVTSRAVLHLSGEHEYSVPPLMLPDSQHLLSADRLSQYAAVALFIDRAQAVKSDFAITNANAPAVAEICYRLDGLPLAIELAAVRLKQFGPEALLKRLEQRLPLLTGGPLDLPVRQQTIRNTIDWSYNLLEAGEQTLFARLGVFVGGCTLEAVAAVCQPETDLSLDVLDRLGSLVSQSLLREEIGPDGEPRFIMLETIREYALELLDASGTAGVLRQAHAGYYIRLAETVEQEILSGQEVWKHRLERDYDNVRAALSWALQTGAIDTAMRLSGAIWRFWEREHMREGRDWLEQTLSASAMSTTPISAAVLVKVLNGAGTLARNQGDYARAQILYTESLALSETLEDKQGIAWVLNALGTIQREQGNHVQAQALHEKSLAISQEIGNKRGIAWALDCLGMVAGEQDDHASAFELFSKSLELRRELGYTAGIANALLNLGSVALLQDEFDQAAALSEESLALQRALGDAGGVALSLFNLGTAVLHQGDVERSVMLFEEGLTLGQELGDVRTVAYCLEGLADTARMQEQPARAARLWGAARALRDANKIPLPPAERNQYEASVAAVRTSLDRATFESNWAVGRAMRLEQAVAYALGRE